jgi:hypothetical protein
MARTCTVCAHPERRAIDRELVTGSLVNRDIAGRYALSKSAVWRHGAEHLPEVLAKAHEAAEAAQGDVLLSQVRQLQGRA